jgi:hypothetical protein
MLRAASLAADPVRRAYRPLWAPAIAVGRHGSNTQNIQFGAQGTIIAARCGPSRIARGPAASPVRRQPPGVYPAVPHPAYQANPQRLRRVVDRTAHLIEELTAHAPAGPAPPRTLSQSSANRALARARTCYDHLAGRLGVAVTQAMTHRGLLRQDAGFALTGDGAAWLTEIGVDLAAARSSRRPLVLPCLDFTERKGASGWRGRCGPAPAFPCPRVGRPRRQRAGAARHGRRGCRPA